MQEVACNLCGARTQRLVYEQPDALFFPDRWFRVVECTVCGLGFVNPRPDEIEMADYYPASFYTVFESATHERRYAEQARHLPAPEPGNAPLLLDVGAAQGDFPRYMQRRGWRVEAVEPFATLRSPVDFPLHRVAFDKLSGAGSRFDAITAWAVLEHAHDPMAYMRAAAHHLKPGAPFVFLVTNFDSLTSRALFREDLPRHLYFFSPRTIARYAQTVGLVLEQITPGHRIFPLEPANIVFHWMKRLQGKRLSWRDLPETRLAFLRRTGRLSASHGLGVEGSDNLAYALAHPIAAFDRIMALIYGPLQRMTGHYGTIVCTLRKTA